MTPDDIDALVRRIKDVPLNQGRRIVGIVGAPASGKTTLATKLAAQIEQACVVPMDGFHRQNEDLEKHGLLPRKGAPQTFHADAFVAFVRACRATPDVSFPTFDRTQDRSIEDSGHLRAEDQTILVEGNYLLLNQDPWDQLAQEWDLSIHLQVPLETLRARLIDRWLAHGYDRDGATRRAESNDIPNAETVLTQSMPADLTLTGG